MVQLTYPIQIELPPGMRHLHTLNFVTAPAASMLGNLPSNAVHATGQLLPREQVTVPICPVTEVSDRVFFMDPQDPAVRYYLPRYRVATEIVSGTERFQVALSQTEQGGVLHIALSKYPAPDLGVEFRQAQELIHDVTVKLQFATTVGASGQSRQELSFDEVIMTGDGIRLTLHIPTLAELTQLYQTMTDPAYGAVLLVERRVTVAIPETPTVLPNNLSTTVTGLAGIDNLPKPEVRFTGAEEYEVRGAWFTRFRLTVDNWSAYPDDLFTPAPDLPPCGLNTAAARTWVEIIAQDNTQLYSFCDLTAACGLQQLWFVIPRGQPAPTDVFIILRDRRTNVVYRSHVVSTAGLTDSAHVLKVSAPLWGKASTDTLALDRAQLSHVNAGDRVSLLIEFPDAPLVPALGASDADQPAELVLTSNHSPQSAEWVEQVAGTVESGAGLNSIATLFFYANYAGQITGFAVNVRVTPPNTATRLDGLTISFQMPTQIIDVPLLKNQNITLVQLQWRHLLPPNEPRFWVGPSYRLSEIELPFTFAEQMHGYIYRGVVGGGKQLFDFLEWQILWYGREHIYLQDATQRHLFYYLPDHFKLTRKPIPPYWPALQVEFNQTTNGQQATLHYSAAPFVELDRLTAAAAELTSRVPELRGPAVTPLVFRPLLVAHKTSFWLALPQAGTSSGPFQERTNARVDLRLGVEDQVTTSLEDFRTIFQSWFEPSALLFQGHVAIELNQHRLPLIPFTAQMDNLIGELFEYTTVPAAHANAWTVTLRNAIESPLQIGGLDIHVTQAATRLEAAISGLTFPTTLNVGKAVNFTVTLPAQAGDLPTTSWVFDLTQVVVQPERDAVWDAIVDHVVQPEYEQNIEVKTVTGLFTRLGLEAIEVEFERGHNVDLNPEQPTAQTTVFLPIRDYVLNLPSGDSYRYRLSVIRTSGITRDAEWREDRGTLYITDAHISGA